MDTPVYKGIATAEMKMQLSDGSDGDSALNVEVWCGMGESVGGRHSSEIVSRSGAGTSALM